MSTFSSWLESHVWLCTYVLAGCALFTLLLKLFVGKSKSSKQESQATVSFSEKENQMLKAWIVSGSIEAHVTAYKGGTVFFLGRSQYDISDSHELICMNDFIARLIQAKFIEQVRFNRYGAPVYQLTLAAYEYLKNLASNVFDSEFGEPPIHLV